MIISFVGVDHLFFALILLLFHLIFAAIVELPDGLQKN